MLSLLTIQSLDLGLCVLGLRLSDNRDEQVEHHNDHEEHRDEEDKPVKVAEEFNVFLEITETVAERALPLG